MLDFYRKSSYNLQHKGKSFSLEVQTENFGIGENSKHERSSFRRKTVQKLDHNEKKNLSVIVNLLTIYQEVLP